MQIEQHLSDLSTLLAEFNEFVGHLKTLKGEDNKENPEYGNFLAVFKKPLVQSNLGINFYQHSLLNQKFQKVNLKSILLIILCM